MEQDIISTLDTHTDFITPHLFMQLYMGAQIELDIEMQDWVCLIVCARGGVTLITCRLKEPLTSYLNWAHLMRNFPLEVLNYDVQVQFTYCVIF